MLNGFPVDNLCLSKINCLSSTHTSSPYMVLTGPSLGILGTVHWICYQKSRFQSNRVQCEVGGGGLSHIREREVTLVRSSSFRLSAHYLSVMYRCSRWPVIAGPPDLWALHSKKRWVVFSTQMLGWDRWVRALGCFNPILGWKLVLIITQRRWVGNADVKESTHVTSTSEGTPTTPVGEAAIFSASKKREANERRYGK